MRTPTEGRDVESKVVAWAKARGIPASKLQVKYDTSYPDRIFWIEGGKPLVIEFKRPGPDPKPKQEYVHGLLRTLGYQVEVHDTVDGAVSSIIRAVEAARRAETRGEIPPRTCGGNLSSRSRGGKDVDNLRSVQDLAVKKGREQDAGHLPAKASLPRVAKRSRKVDGLQGPKGGGSPRKNKRQKPN